MSWERVVEAMKSEIVKVTYELDEDGWWVADVPAIQGCHTQGRTIGEARKRIRDAMWCATEDREWAFSVKMEDDVKLPSPVAKKLLQARRARDAAVSATKRAEDSTREVIEELSGKMRMSVRDVGDLIGVSGQRIQQLRRRGTGSRGTAA